MNTEIVEKKFNEMGARVKFNEPLRRNFRTTRPFTIDIRKDGEGEFFDIRVKEEIEMLVLDVQKKDRHLLLMARDPDNPKAKFLCGHDERAWFTCAVPESAGVSSVFQAKQALKPKELQELESQEGLKTSRAHKRHRKLKSGRKIHRQGEFMFIPQHGWAPPTGFETTILKNEPMQRGGGNSHNAEYLFRRGGTRVYVSRYSQTAQNGITETEYQRILKEDATNVQRHNWRIMVRNPEVYAKGRISHVEHKTLNLGNVWHKVVLNTEDMTYAAGNVTFLD